MPPHQDRPIPLADVARRGPQRGRPVLEDARVHVEALLRAVESLSPARVERALDVALAAGSVEHVVQLVLMPLLREIGDRWESGALGVAHEHLASGVINRRIGSLGVGLEEGSGPSAVLACPPGERHDLVLGCFALLLQREGWRVYNLGADTPTAAIALTCRQTDADLLVLAGTRPSVFTSRFASLRRLAGSVPTAIAGSGADVRVARELGAVLLPNDPVPAVDVVTGMIRRPGPGGTRLSDTDGLAGAG
ncbi:cobalamin B12-binding domain-containing protein [Arsenicicoccus sp. oral taxon 190]|uniref:cobalamin B12-binding domain-containing protein n=1 Tax=Arsenicicoccus sp. oral taxon 190 TaxID=1658671 RepID=UPI00067DF04E|nr:B12-binding domain-containing protein [Arsenicicoccus sp. oral taxon 190]